MKYRIKIWHIFFLLPVLISAQVGVNTTNPNALLDISTSNPSSPNNTDGLLIPKIDEYPSINPTAIQDGMLVYATGNGSVAKGFYYWDNNTASWVSFTGATIEKIDDLLDGKSDNDGTDDGSSIFLGINAGANDDGSDNQNVGVGYDALNSNTSIGYRSLLDNSSGDQNVAVGYHALQNNTTGNNNVAIGYNSLNLVTTGYSNTALGTSAGAAGATFYNTTALGNGAAPNSPNQVRLGNSSVSVIGGYANWSNFSDRRLKTNIQENIVGLEFIKKLRPVSYNYDMDAIARFENTPDSLRIREAEKLKTQEIQTGFIAQEVEQAAQAVGFDFHGVVKPYDENGTYALRYAEFVVPLVKAMQEQQEVIETQNQELKSLREEIEAIKTLLKENYKID
ncbi:MAG: hypothetical protein CMC76_06415 [Flavobacteriaceae bacterium]|nr:hypothetical protein [Flavobacteriaceae bacterium]|tara:strand:+ start:1807 stop:2988 length:1182 start_codon:yes stop_codon:yes gene_type:complete